MSGAGCCFLQKKNDTKRMRRCSLFKPHKGWEGVRSLPVPKFWDSTLFLGNPYHSTYLSELLELSIILGQMAKLIETLGFFKVSVQHIKGRLQVRGEKFYFSPLFRTEIGKIRSAACFFFFVGPTNQEWLKNCKCLKNIKRRIFV